MFILLALEHTPSQSYRLLFPTVTCTKQLLNSCAPRLFREHERLDERHFEIFARNSDTFFSWTRQLKLELHLRVTDPVSVVTKLPNFRQLRTLSLSCAGLGIFTKNAVTSITSLVSLEELDLCVARFGDNAFAALQSLTNLKKLTVSCCCNLTNSMMETIGCFSLLTHLKCSFVEGLSGSAGLELISEKCPRLEYLDMHSLKGLNDTALTEIGKFVNLTSLLCTQCSVFTCAGFSRLKPLMNLRVLSMNGCVKEQVADVLFLSNFVVLEWLCIGFCNLDDAAIKIIGNCTLLRKLDVGQNTAVTDLSPLSGLKDLRSLSVATLAKVRDFTFLKNLTQLQVLNLSVTLCADADIDILTASCKQLERLNIRNCEFVTDLCIPLFARLERLKTVIVADNSMTEEGHDRLAWKYRTLGSIFLL